MRRLVTLLATATAFIVLVPAAPAQATFPGRNGRIAFSMDRGNGAELYTIRANGTGLQRITHGDRNATFPDWSPDGSKIVFELDLPGEDCGSIEMMNADGSGLVDLTEVSSVFERACANGPSFTPDGRRILFAAEARGRPGAIWSIDLQGRHVRRILRVDRLDPLVPRDKSMKAPRVSPNGRMVSFVVEHGLRRLDSNEKGLFRVNMNGTHLEEIVPLTLDISIKGGDWSPNGKRLVVTDHAGPLPSTEPSNVLTVRPDGTGLRQLTDYRQLPPDALAGSSSYSPDGRWIVFKHVNGSKFTLWKMRTDGGHLTRIARMRFVFSGTDWGPRPR